MVGRLVAVVLALALVVAPAGGCTYGEVEADGRLGSPTSTTCHRWLWGLIVPDVVYPVGMGRVAMGKGPVDWLLTLITGGFYAPVSVKIWPLLPEERPIIIQAPAPAPPPAQPAAAPATAPKPSAGE